MTDIARQGADDRRPAVCRACAAFLGFILTTVLYLPSSAVASPSSVRASYDVHKSGIKIGKIEETYTIDNGRYTLTSTTRPAGLVALFKPGKIILNSSGLVDAHGLRPLNFSDRREGEERRNRSAEFDWDAKQLTLIHQAQRTALLLPKGTQDRLSAMYQFMFLSLERSDVLNFSMTNGGKLDIYSYRITPGQSVTVPLGTFKALYLASIPEAGASRTEIWLATEHFNFPYKLVVTEADGGKISQVLTKFEAVP